MDLINSLLSVVIIVIVVLQLILELQPTVVERIPVLLRWKRKR